MGSGTIAVRVWVGVACVAVALGCGGDDDGGRDGGGALGDASLDAARGSDGEVPADGASVEDSGEVDAFVPPMPDHWLDGEWDLTETAGEILGESFEFTNSEVTIVHDDDSLSLTPRTLSATLSGGGTRSIELEAESYALDGESVLEEAVAVGTLADGLLSIEECSAPDSCHRLTITWIDPDRLAYEESQITAGTTQAAGTGVLRRRGSYVPATLSIVDTTPDVSPGLLASAILVLEVQHSGTEHARRMVASASGAGTLVPRPDGAAGTPCGDELAPGATCHLYLELAVSGSTVSASAAVSFWTVGLTDVAGISVTRTIPVVMLQPDLSGILSSRLLAEIRASTSDLDGNVLVIGAGQSGEYYNGGVYVFRYDGTTWNQEQRLRDPATELGRTRGVNDVAVHGNLIAVAGATSTSLYRHDGTSWVADGSVTGGGAVYMDATTLIAGAHVYTLSGSAWIEAQQLVLPAADSELFQIEIDGSWLAAGLDTTPTNSERNGAALMYRWDGTAWTFDQRIDPASGTEVKQLALRGDEVLLGTPGLNNTGWTNLYRHDGTDWVYVQDIVPWTTGGAPSSDFTQFNIGAGVWLGADVAIAGASGYRSCGTCTRTGGGFVFTRDASGWSISSARLPTSSSLNRAGYALVSDGRWLFVGGATDNPPFADPFGLIVRVGP